MVLYLTIQVVVLHSEALTPMGSEMWLGGEDKIKSNCYDSSGKGQ